MPSTESTFDVGTLKNGSWRCACNRSPVWRTVAKEGPTKGERFLRCAPPRGKWDTQCSFYLWEAHKEDAEATMRQQNAPVVTIPGLTPTAPRTPSPPARRQSSSTLTSTTGTLTPGPSPTPSATSTLPKLASAASTASSLSCFGTQTSTQSSTLFGSQPFGQNNKLFSTLSNPPSSSSFGSQAPQPAEPFKAPSIIPSGTLFSSQATAKPSPLFGTQPSAQPSGLFGPQPGAPSTTSLAPQPKVQHSAEARPRNLGPPTPEKTPHKPSMALEEDSSEVLNQIISRLGADGVPLRPSTEEYLGHILREEIAIYEAKLRAKDVTIARLMQQIDRLSVKGY
ncbi:hypothetical protein HJFPF1_07494 [Paramyrothecium foliicola]|nr:hypothetical protein HJFPF1_07494 [Paramyrothecium foliicola]